MADRALQNDTHIDQMRELMIGPQLREYHARLEQVESKQAVYEDSTQKRIDEVTDGLLGQLNKAVAESDKKVRAQDLKTKEERSELQADFEQFEEALCHNLGRV